MRYITRALFFIVVFILAEGFALHFRPLMRTLSFNVFSQENQSRPFYVLSRTNTELKIQTINAMNDHKHSYVISFPVAISDEDSTRLNAYCSSTIDTEGNHIVKLRLPRENRIYHYAVHGNTVIPFYTEEYVVDMQASLVYAALFIALSSFFYTVYLVEKKFILKRHASNIA